MLPASDKLWEYAHRYQSWNESNGRGTQYRTVRSAARRFRCKQQDIIDVVESGCVSRGRCFDLLVGFRAGDGIAEAELVGDYEIEAYEA